MKREAIAWTAVAAAVIVAAWLLRGPVVTNDSVQYLRGAALLRAGDGVATDVVHFDTEAAHGTLPAPLTTFPPGQPLLIAGLGPNLPAMLGYVGVVPLLVWLAAAWGLSRGRTRALLLVWIGSAAAVEFGLGVASDLTFAALVTLAVVAATVAEQRGSLGGLAAAALVAGASAWVRYAGALVVIGFLVWGAARVRRDRRAAILALAVLPVAALAARNWALTRTLGGGNTKAVAHGLGSLLRIAGHGGLELFFALRPGVWIALALAAAVATLLSLRRWPRGAGLLATVGAVYLAGILYVAATTPISFGARMLLPLVPLGLALIVAAADGRIVPLAAALYAVGQGHALLVDRSVRSDLRVEMQLVGPARAWLDAHPGTLMASEGQMTALVLHRPMVSLVEAEYSDRRWTEAEVRRTIDRDGVVALVLYRERQLDSPFLAGLLGGQVPSWLAVVAESPGALVLQVVGRPM